MSPPENIQSGVRESNAGDDFHFLWAQSRVLDLLSPSTDLEAVAIEGFDPNDPIAKHESLVLGADLVEYFGGTTFEAADRVVISQLKYGTRTAGQPWSASILGRSSRKNGPSTISRMAELFRALVAEHPREEILRKVRIALVSNRAAVAKLTTLVDDCQRCLSEGIPFGNELFKELGTDQTKELKLLLKHSKLEESQFEVFIQLFDLSQCGSSSRSVLEAEIARSARELFTDSARAASDHLYRRMIRAALPEAEGGAPLTREDVLATAGVTSEELLFPVSSLASRIQNPIGTKDRTNLIAGVTDSPKLLAHGGAGVGKTTTLLELEDGLPDGSVVLFYDCFGTGSYLDQTQSRHLPTRAIFQLVNELAMRCGTPLMVEQPKLEADLWREFQRRIEMAAEGLKDTSRLLVIAIDAADNAAFAAHVNGDESFLQSLWALPLPPKVHLVMTGRTHRIDQVAPPDDTPQLELVGFDEAASATHLRQRFHEATGDDCKEFHEATTGNPRVQFYVTDAARNPNLDLPAALIDARRTPEDIFEDVVRVGLEEVSDPTKAGRHLADLVSISRPITIAVFAPATGLDQVSATRFCAGLVPGIAIDGNAINFRDEDFEKYLRQRVGPEGEAEAHLRLADYFQPRSETEPAAALAIAEHLFRANEFERLAEFVLDAGEPRVLEDPVLRLECYRRRLHFALRGALSTDDLSRAFMAAVLAGEAAMSNSAITSVVERQPALAMRFGDPDAVASIYLNQRNESWKGPLHVQSSAMFARNSDFISAREHFRLARAWLRESVARNESEPHDSWHFSDDDIAAGAEAVYWVDGLGSAIGWIRRWRPLSVRRTATVILARRLIAHEDEKVLRAAIRSTRLAVVEEAAFLRALSAAGRSVSLATLRELVPRFERALKRNGLVFDKYERWQDDDADWALSLAEYSASKGVSNRDILALVKRSSPALPDWAPRLTQLGDSFDMGLRRLCLEAEIARQDLDVEDALPPRFHKTDKHGRYIADADERRRYTEVIRNMLPAYQLRARVLRHTTRIEEIDERVRELIQTRISSSQSRWRKFDRNFRVWQSRIADAILAADGEGKADLLEVLANAAQEINPGQVTFTWLDLAEIAIIRDSTRVRAIDLVDRAATRAEASSMPASDASEVLLRCASLVEAVDTELAADYFARSVVSAAGIDDESVSLLRMHCNLVRQGPQRTGREVLALRMANLVTAFDERITSDTELPFTETLTAATRLSPSGALALCSRWHDERWCTFDDGIPAIVRGLATSEAFSASDAILLLRMAGERRSPVREAILHLERMKDSGIGVRADLIAAISRLTAWIHMNLETSLRPDATRQLWSWVTESGLSDQTELASLKSLADRFGVAEAEMPTRRDERRPTIRKDGEEVEEIPLATVENWSVAMRALNESYSTDKQITKYLIDSGAAITPADRVAFLEHLTNLQETDELLRWSPLAILETLDGLLKKWANSTPVARWGRRDLADFIERHLAILLRQPWNMHEGLRVIVRLPLEDRWSRVLLRGLYANLDQLSSAQLFAVAETLAGELSLDDRDTLLEWSIERLQRRVGINSVTKFNNLPESDMASLAGFLYASFGAEDRRVRWRAVHLSRAFARDGRPDVIAQLLQLTGAKSIPAFTSEQFGFPWLSAQQSLFALFARLASEHPEMLVAGAPSFYDVATSEDVPHAAIRDLAKRTALGIHAHSDTYTPDQLDALQTVNVPTRCRAELETNEAEDDEDGIDVDTVFKFDVLDTVPKWFGGLARVFGIPVRTVTVEADKWVGNLLQITTDEVWKDRRELRREREWELTSTRHGELPAIETLRGYAEYHSMLLAAGALLDAGTAVAPDEWNKESDPWQEWLSEFVEARSGRWLSDLRSPTPHEWLVSDVDATMENWRTPSEQMFQSVILSGERLVLHSYVNLESPDAYSSIRVKTALVPSETAESLARALQAADPNEFYLPYEDGEGFSGQGEIDSGEFALYGLVRESENEVESLEKYDPLRRIDARWHCLGRRFLDPLGADLDKEDRVALRSTGEIVGHTLAWSDQVEEESRERPAPYVSGDRLEAPIGFVIEVLKATGRSLIFDVEASFFARGGYERSSGNDSIPTRIYLLREDGTIR